MKSLLLVTIVLLFSFTVSAQSKAPTYKVDGDITAWNALLDALDKSTASHADVKALQSWIVSQVKAQMDAEQKKANSKKADSVSIKPVKPVEQSLEKVETKKASK